MEVIGSDTRVTVVGQDGETAITTGSALSALQPGDFLVIGNPAGSISSDAFIVLRDPYGRLIDDVIACLLLLPTFSYLRKTKDQPCHQIRTPSQPKMSFASLINSTSPPSFPPPTLPVSILTVTKMSPSAHQTIDLQGQILYRLSGQRNKLMAMRG